MVTEAELLERVEAAFARLGRDHPGWVDPHPDRSPLDEEYSRVTDAARYRILGARTDAWLAALTELGLARVEDGHDVSWTTTQLPVITRAVRAVPFVEGGLVLVVARSRLGEVDDAGVTLGVGEPTSLLGYVPDCGCDACDSGSQDELDVIDRSLRSVTTGAFRRLDRGGQTITASIDQWSATGLDRSDDVEAILRDPTGWTELTGPSWLAAPAR